MSEDTLKIVGTVDFHKRNSHKHTASLGFMPIANITYSVASTTWFARMYNISDEVYECNTVDECKEAVSEAANAFLSKCGLKEVE